MKIMWWRSKSWRKTLVFVEFSEENSERKMDVTFSVFRPSLYSQSLFVLAFVVGSSFGGSSLSGSSFGGSSLISSIAVFFLLYDQAIEILV